MIYISTGQFFDQSFVDSTKIINSYKIKHIELSSGKYIKNYNVHLDKICKKNKIIFHNYFPRPKRDFIINLCSENNIIRDKSYRHIVKCINLCKKYNVKFFSFHAGFLFNPNVTKIGGVYDRIKLYNKKKSLKTFVRLTNKLSKLAKNKGVVLLIENNVISKNNYTKFKTNPFLMADIKDTLYIMNNTNKNVGLLTDLAHLKISAKTLKFSKIDFLNKTRKWNFGYHISENNGKEDTNEKISNQSWFWKHINKNLEYYTLEIKFKNNEDILKQYKLLKRKLKYA